MVESGDWLRVASSNPACPSGKAWFIIAAKVILLKPLLTAIQPSTRYDVLFLILTHATFGVRDTHIVLHTLVAYGWFDIET